MTTVSRHPDAKEIEKNLVTVKNKFMADMRNITLKQLRALSAVVDSGSVTAAAARLFVTPPAVSTQLRTLEEHLGIEVIGRGPGGITAPTAAGEAVLATTARIESALAECVRRVEALREGQEGYVTLGVVSTGKYFAPGLVSRMQAEYPHIEISLKVGNRGEIVRALAENEIELAIMGRPPEDMPVEAALLGEHPYIVIAPPNHPLVRQRRIGADDLMAQTFLMRERGSGTRTVMTRVLDRIAEGRPYRTVVMGTNETIKQAVMAGLGIAFISAHTVVSELESRRLTALPIEGMPFLRQWWLIHRSDGNLTPVTLQFRKFILRLEGSFLPRLTADEADYSALGFEHKMDQT